MASTGVFDQVLEEIQFLLAQGFSHRDAVHAQVMSFTLEGSAMPEEELERLVREAVEGAFDQKIQAMRAWPSPTDGDRLRAAFDALQQRGFVVLENAGLTQDDSIAHAAAIAAARDELGGRDAHAYCYFTWNDMARAIDGDGLSLAYGTFEEESAPPPPTKCSVCNGRGFVTSPDPAVGSTFCACMTKAQPAAPQAAVPTKAQKAGAAVLEACREAGLDAQWDGRPEAFVELPAFRWQRRVVLASEADVRDFLDGWEIEVRARDTSVGKALELLDERAQDWFEGVTDFGPAIRRRLHAHAEAFLRKEQGAEQAWSGATVNDRVRGAFEELEGEGVFTGECLGMTIQDGWGYAGTAVSDAHRAVVFFHHEDVIDAIGGGALYLAFGAIGPRKTVPTAEAETAALGRRIVAALERHGVRCSWSGTARDRIRIEPFVWQMRRWTVAPAYERGAPLPEPKRPSLLARVFGRKSTPPPAAVAGPQSAPSLGKVVRTLRDEGGFHVRRAREMRAAWKAAGFAGDAQVGHVGVPHVFLPAGQYAALAPRLASVNLLDEKDAIFERGVRASVARNA